MVTPARAQAERYQRALRTSIDGTDQYVPALLRARDALRDYDSQHADRSRQSVLNDAARIVLREQFCLALVDARDAGFEYHYLLSVLGRSPYTVGYAVQCVHAIRRRRPTPWRTR